MPEREEEHVQSRKKINCRTFQVQVERLFQGENPNFG
jgi:hypothetical protein